MLFPTSGETGTFQTEQFSDEGDRIIVMEPDFLMISHTCLVRENWTRFMKMSFSRRIITSLALHSGIFLYYMNNTKRTLHKDSNTFWYCVWWKNSLSSRLVNDGPPLLLLLLLLQYLRRDSEDGPGHEVAPSGLGHHNLLLLLLLLLLHLLLLLYGSGGVHHHLGNRRLQLLGNCLLLKNRRKFKSNFKCFRRKGNGVHLWLGRLLPRRRH